MSNQGINKLAQVMQQRMSRNRDADSALVLDFGTIQMDMSLKTNTFAVPIPSKDYHVARQLALGPAGGDLTSTGNGDDVLIPEKMRSLAPGDRVLVAWVQSEAVVIDIIVPAASV